MKPLIAEIVALVALGAAFYAGTQIEFRDDGDSLEEAGAEVGAAVGSAVEQAKEKVEEAAGEMKENLDQ